MKAKVLIALCLLTLPLIGCKRVITEQTLSSQQITLGAITEATTTTRATVSPLSQGEQLRLYVLPRNATDMTKVLLTRTYTISDDAGTPILDAGQDEIKLSASDYDFYLVGPLTGIDKTGTPVEIAAENQINVHIGNDIISSLTKHTVALGANVINPTPLSHRMAKVEFIVSRPEGAVYTDLKVKEITLSNQPTTGTFSFGADGGSITAATDVETRTYIPKIATDAGTPELTKYEALDYVLPQPSKELKIETTFDATAPAAGVPTEKTYLQSGIIQTAIAAGEHHQFLAEPITPIELLWRLKLVPWYDKDQGSTSTDDGELILEYSGLDAPITIDGVKYWFDRSGNGNHGKIGAQIIYDANGKYYTSKSAIGGGIVVPNLGEVRNITMEVVMSSRVDATCTPVDLRAVDNSASKIHTPHKFSNLYLDWGSTTDDRLGLYSYMPNDSAAFLAINTWQYIRDVQDDANLTTGIYSAIHRNGVKITSRNQRYRALDFATGELLAAGGNNMKLYALRIYRRVLSNTELTRNTTNDRAKYAKIATNDVNKYVQRGLVLDLQGSIAPSTTTVAGQTAWVDQSIHKNHAIYLNGGATHDAAKKGFKFSGTGANQIMKLVRGLGDLSDCTIEIVMTAGAATNATSINLMDAEGAIMFSHKAPSDKYGVLFPGNDFYLGGWVSYTDHTKVQTWSAVRNTKTETVTLSQNAMAQMSTLPASTMSQAIASDKLALNQVTDAQIGGKVGGSTFDGYIHAVRVYNRALSDNERYINYELDKSIYEILN